MGRIGQRCDQRIEAQQADAKSSIRTEIRYGLVDDSCGLGVDAAAASLTKL